jgi:hypothetical protein
MMLKTLGAACLIVIPTLAFAAGGGGTGVSNAGNGAPGGANSDASNGNTPVDAPGAYITKGASATDQSGADSMGVSTHIKRENQERQKAP